MSILTPEGRMSYPHLFKSQKNDLNGKEEFSVVLIFPLGANLQPLIEAAQQVVIEEHGPDKSKWPTPLRSPFRKCKERWKVVEGKEVIPAGYEEGEAIFMNFKQDATKGKPTVVDAKVQDIIEPQHIYAGCYGRCSVRAYYYSQKGNKGIAFGLSNVQKLRDGAPLGAGRMKASEEFSPVAEEMATTTTDALFG
jgi:hypothetical protein